VKKLSIYLLGSYAPSLPSFPPLPTLEFLSVAVIKVWSIFSYVIVSNNDVEKAKRGFPWHPWHMLTLISCQVFRSGREGKCLESIIFK